MSRKKRNPQSGRISRTRSQSTKLGITYTTTKPPFAGLSETEMLELMATRGKKADAKFKRTLKQLQKEVGDTDPFMMLALFTRYGLFASVDMDPELDREEPILQLHVELLQALSLRQKSSNKRQWNPQIFEKLHRLVRTVHSCFMDRRFGQLDPSTSKDVRKRMAALESFRLNTQAVRNWGYPDQIRRIVSGLFALLDNDIEREFGIRVESLVRMNENLKTLVENRLNDYQDRLRSVFKAKSLEEIFRNYCNAFPVIQNTPEEVHKAFEDKGGTTLEQARDMLFLHSELWIPDIFMLSMKDFLNAYPGRKNQRALKKIIDGWSFSFGDLGNEDSEYFFMGNPIWSRPLIKLTDDTYFCPIIGLLHSFSLELMESIIQPNERLTKKYEASRSEYLVKTLEELFMCAFPSAKLYVGSYWNDPQTGKRYENDLLIHIDSILIVIEAKSGRVTTSARRGGERRIERTINDLQIEPSEQSFRFSEFLRSNPGPHEFSTKHGVVNKVDTSNVQIIIRLNCILDELPALGLGWPTLKAAGFIPTDLAIAPTMSLMDLDTVFIMLDSESLKLHYLVRRAEFEEHADYVGDEMDLLAFYIDTMFAIGDSEYGEEALMLFGISSTMRPFLMPGQEDRPKPKPRYTRWWLSIIEFVEKRKMAGWTLIEIILLSTPYEKQVQAETIVRERQSEYKKRSATTEEDEGMFLPIGGKQGNRAIMLLVFKNTPIETRYRWMLNLADQAVGIDKTRFGVVLAVEAKQDIMGEYPYTTLLWFGKYS